MTSLKRPPFMRRHSAHLRRTSCIERRNMSSGTLLIARRIFALSVSILYLVGDLGTPHSSGVPTSHILNIQSRNDKSHTDKSSDLAGQVMSPLLDMIRFNF